MDISWEDARLFLQVAETGSVSAGARKSRVTQPTASRRLAALESQVGEPLFVRKPSGVVLTPFGERLLAPAKAMAEAAAELERAAERAETSIDGTVRITAPPGFADDFCVPFSAFVREKLPGVRLEIVSSLRYLDLSRREADLALRLERPVHPDLVSLCSLELDVVAFAARALISRIPRRPKVADVPWVGWAPPLDDLPPNSALARLIPGFRPSFASDDYLVQYRAAELGLGAIILGRIRHRFSREPLLVEIEVEGLPKFKSALHLVCAKSALDVPRIRAVAELMRSALASARTSKTKR